MKSSYFYSKTPQVINGVKIEPFKAYRVTNSNLPALLVLQENGKITFTATDTVPVPSSAREHKPATGKVAEAHRRSRRRNPETEAPPMEPEL